MADFLNLINVVKAYGEGESRVKVLKEINIILEKGKICAILGPSGSGKSTLLNVVGGLDSVDQGSIIIGEKTDITKLRRKEIAQYRRDYLGFIFQFYNLIPNLTVRENIQVCEYLSDDPLLLDELLETIGMTEHQNKFPSQLSGGQQQRCAIARSLIKNPELLLCDEPTGALDSKSAKDILVLIDNVNRKYGTTILLVTHNADIEQMAHMIIHMKDGTIVSCIENDNKKNAQDIEW
jgi:putative ABC transport system ATP-binding protein